MDEQKKKEIESILEGYFRQEWNESLTRDIQAWLLSADSEAEKEEALRQVWERYYRTRPGYGARAVKGWERTCRRLGFQESVMEIPVRKRFNPQVWMKVAAVIVPFLLLVGGLWLVRGSKADLSEHEYVVSVSKDNWKQIVLPCGSKVWIRNETQIRYGSNFMENRNILLEGEAYFQVVSVEGKPFTVRTSELTVTVLGTEFNLRDYPAESSAEVSLTKGSVEVSVGPQKTVLAPNERFLVDRHSRRTQLTEFDRKQLENRWNGKKLYMDDVPLTEALQMVADFYGKILVFTEKLSDNSGVRLPVSPDDELREVLSVMKTLNNSFSYTIINDTILIGMQ